VNLLDLTLTLSSKSFKRWLSVLRWNRYLPGRLPVHIYCMTAAIRSHRIMLA